MKIRHILPALLLLTATGAQAQKLSFDSKYIKVGVVVAGTAVSETAFTGDPNIRYLGQTELPFTLVTDKKSERSKAAMQAVARRLAEAGLGKKTLDRILERDAAGLHIDRLYDEALSNTTIEETAEASLDVSAETKDVLKREIARQLMKNNFIVLTSSNKEGTKWWWHAFHVDIDDRIIDQAFNTWNDPARYDQIEVPVTYRGSGEIEGGMRQALSGGVKAPSAAAAMPLLAAGIAAGKALRPYFLIQDIAKEVPEFAVRGPVVTRRPFVARTGAKQGVRPGDLLYVYRAFLDKDSTICSKKICSVRATEVGPDSVRLYTVSGRMASNKLGDIAVYRGRHRWAFSAMWQGSFGSDARHGARLLWERRFRGFSPKGRSHYFLVGLDVNAFKSDPKGVWFDNDGQDEQPKLMSGGINLGYGIGWHFLGRLELMPYALVGAQLAGLTKSELQYYDKEQEKWADFTGGLAGVTPFFAGHAGLRLNVNLWYPVQLTVGADYNCNIPLSKKNEAAYDNHDLNRLNFYAGLRFNL